MPTEIIPITGSPEEDFAIVPPEHGLFFEVYDPTRGTSDILVVRCMPHDQATDIYLFGNPGEDFSEAGIDDETLAKYCIEANFATQVDHESGCHIDMYDYDGRPLELLIGHNATMSRN